MPVNALALAQTINTSVDAAEKIARFGLDLEQRFYERGVNNDQRDAAVAAYTQRMYLQMKKNSRRNFAILVNRADLRLNVEGELDNLVGANECIHGYYYSLRIVWNVQITNNGDRGFRNWSVYGNNIQRDNVIYVNPSKWRCILRHNGQHTRDVIIWWGHHQTDGEWACNQWCTRCRNGGGCRAERTSLS